MSALPAPALAIPPHNVDAERTVLGAMLVDNAAMDSVSDLEPSEFYREAHRRVFSAMLRLRDTGAAVDLVTLKDELARTGMLDKIGGAAYLGSLVDGLPRMSKVGQWAKIIRRNALCRRVALVADKMHEAATEADQEPEGLIERSIGALLALAGKAGGEGFLDNKELTKRALREIEDQANSPDGILGLRTGLIDLDRRLQGIRPGQLGIIAGRLKSGKSVLALQLAEYVADVATAEKKGRAVLFTLEMSGVALTKRRLASRALVPVNLLHAAEGRLRDEKWADLVKAANRVSAPDLMLCSSAYTVPRMRSLCRQVQAEHGLVLVVVDYLQLTKATRKHDKRHSEVAEVSADLKRLAIDLDVPVVAVAQLNRAPEGRKDKTPTMADLADSDALGRDCDWAVLIHRDPKGAGKHEADLIVGANREGWTGSVRVHFAGFATIFQNAAPTVEEALAHEEHD
jgi:replicative DNA helicase